MSVFLRPAPVDHIDPPTKEELKEWAYKRRSQLFVDARITSELNSPIVYTLRHHWRGRCLAQLDIITEGE